MGILCVCVDFWKHINMKQSIKAIGRGWQIFITFLQCTIRTLLDESIFFSLFKVLSKVKIFF
jgi:hypothetical protein